MGELLQFQAPEKKNEGPKNKEAVGLVWILREKIKSFGKDREELGKVLNTAIDLLSRGADWQEVAKKLGEGEYFSPEELTEEKILEAFNRREGIFEKKDTAEKIEEFVDEAAEDAEKRVNGLAAS